MSKAFSFTTTSQESCPPVLLLFAVLCIYCAVALGEPQFPKLTGRVVDQASLLSASDEQSIASQLKQHEDKTSNQVVVVTLKNLQGYDIADYGYRLGRHWGIGQKEKNNGALLIVAPNERKVRIEVGYGLEGDLTDALSHDIIQTKILPRFRQGSYAGGIKAGVNAMLQAIAGSYKAGKKTEKDNFDDIVPLIVFFIALMIIMNRRSRGGRRRSGGAIFLPGNLGSSGGFGGGGFGGGGGGFGGGGASGGW